MSPIEQLRTTRKLYRYRLWLRTICGLFGCFLAVGGVAILLDAAFLPIALNPIPAFFAVVPLGFAAYLLALTFRPRIVIDGASIQVRGAFTDRSATLSQIAGIRARPSRYGACKQLLLKDGGRPIILRPGFKVDDDYRDWIAQVPDLDRRDRDALLVQIAAREDLGATPAERLGALARARRLNIALLVLVAAAAAGFDLTSAKWGSAPWGSAPWAGPCAVALALAPLATAWLCWRRPLFFAVFKRRQDPRAETSYGLLIAAFALIVPMGEFHLLSLQPLLPGMLLLGAITVAAYYRHARNGYGNRVVFAIAVLAALYAYGALTMLDVCLDASAADHYSTTVTGNHIGHGRSTSYYLRLAPWGPVPIAQDVSVSASLYHAAAPGDTVCLDLHRGQLRAPWFRVVSCSAPQQP